MRFTLQIFGAGFFLAALVAAAPAAPAGTTPDALMEWAKNHKVDVPEVGAAFEGTADYSVSY
ncbi:uncharacterized protein F4822DRAFT_430281 [Hypoxylon trugodes]|uniref:uncharacterized protein n=1 Tax=Hypoxylon trugodes TaxID=326681 RepID=UPI00219CCBF9|nr:uncharacterized protein F4822DRAFT_430281 [Hypoxylon trugodes]KAI1387534.1 hypothetical protein F4822DRAFT_430281 [Hypoxylon trugodes]